MTVETDSPEHDEQLADTESEPDEQNQYLLDDESLGTTPIYDALARLRSRDIKSFHALPLSRSGSLRGSAFEVKYAQAFGQAALSSDLTYTGDAFDTPAMPKRCIERSRQITATAFGARYSTYVTTGTTTSNFVSVYSLCEDGCRVLADRLCHQSIHFALMRARARVTYTSSLPKDEDSNRAAIDVEGLIRQYRQAHEQGDPFQVVVLSNCSYEGVIQDVKAVISACTALDERVRFLVDEAWFAYGYFHRLYRPFTAMYAANAIAPQPQSFAVLATQSAHKSLSALRQGSYIHIHGDKHIIKTVRETQYAYHTTSPSYPILASLELARAQAAVEGADRIEKLLHETRRLRHALATDPQLQGYFINESTRLRAAGVTIDPLRISVNVSNLTSDVHAFKRFLLDRHAIYISSTTATSFLLNIHLGLDEACIDQLLEALSDFVRTERSKARPVRAPSCAPSSRVTTDGVDTEPKNTWSAPHEISDRYLIPYPPGVPAIVPGDVLSPQILDGLARLHDAGVDVFSIRPGSFTGETKAPVRVLPE
jgi:arginine/lysine/ornithine decarboxylase